MQFKAFTDYLEGENFIKTTLISLVSSFLILTLLYFLKLRFVEDFIPRYGTFIFFIVLCYSLILFSLKHVRACEKFASMSGMLVGMTLGMIAGFVSGFYVGATNGVFFGSVFGMSIGILFGVWSGRYCGIMGVIEGTLAGFMGGLMGAMASLMMLNDHLRSMAVIVFAFSGFSLLGLNYLVYKESGLKKTQESDFFVIFWSILLTIITVWLMVFGPRSALFQ